MSPQPRLSHVTSAHIVTRNHLKSEMEDKEDFNFRPQSKKQPDYSFKPHNMNGNLPYKNT